MDLACNIYWLRIIGTDKEQSFTALVILIALQNVLIVGFKSVFSNNAPKIFNSIHWIIISSRAKKKVNTFVH